MTLTAVVVYWGSLLGTVDLAEIKAKYFETHEYECKTVQLDYPSIIAMHAIKDIQLIPEGGGIGMATKLRATVDTCGSLLVTMDIPSSVIELHSLVASSFHIPQFGDWSGSLLDVVMKIITDIFGYDSLVMLAQEANLRTPRFLERSRSVGIEPWHHHVFQTMVMHLTLEGDDESDYSAELDGLKQAIVSSSGKQMLSMSPLASALLDEFNDEDILPDVPCHGSHNGILLLRGSPTTVSAMSSLHEQLVGITMGADLASSILAEIENELSVVFDYIETEENVSWLFVRNEYERLIHFDQKLRFNLERRFMDKGRSRSNDLDVNAEFFKKLEDLAGVPDIRSNYFKRRARVEDKLTRLEFLMADKAETEEQVANERLVQIIGAFAVIEVFLSLLGVISNFRLELLIQFLVVLAFLPIVGLFWAKLKRQTRSNEARAKELRRRNELEENVRDISATLDYMDQLMVNHLISDDVYEKEKEVLQDLSCDASSELRNMNTR